MSPSANESPTLPTPNFQPPAPPSLSATEMPARPTMPLTVSTPDSEFTMPTLPTTAPAAVAAPAPTSTPIMPATLSAPTLPSPTTPSTATAPPAPATAPATAPPAPTLDGDLPRLGTTSAAPARVVPKIDAPNLSHLDLPTLPTVVAVPEIRDEPEVEEPTDADTSGEPVHPMAHLMPAKSAPSEAKRRAEEIRAAKKAKARKIKLAVAAVVVVLTVGVGPFVYKFISNGLNDAGKTTTEEPTG